MFDADGTGALVIGVEAPEEPRDDRSCAAFRQVAEREVSAYDVEVLVVGDHAGDLLGGRHAERIPGCDWSLTRGSWDGWRLEKVSKNRT